MLRVLLFLLVMGFHACRKADVTTPDQSTPVNLPTEEIEGKYVWHGYRTEYTSGGDTTIGMLFTAEIIVADDSTINIVNKSSMSYYFYYPPLKLISIVASKIFFSNGKEELTYDTITKRIERAWSGTKLYAVANQTKIWQPILEVNMERPRLWHRRRQVNYYDPFVMLTDTVCDAFSLYRSFANVGKDSLFFGGADSTYGVYYHLVYNSTYGIRNNESQIEYYPENDSLYIHSGLFGAVYEFYAR